MNNYDRCVAYLEKLPPAISGAGGHNATLRAACETVRFGLSESEARRAMAWWNENKCKPRWTDNELAHKLQSAQSKAKQGTRARGRWQRAQPDWSIVAKVAEQTRAELAKQSLCNTPQAQSTRRYAYYCGGTIDPVAIEWLTIDELRATDPRAAHFAELTERIRETG